MSDSLGPAPAGLVRTTELKLVSYPHPALRWKSREVKRIDGQLRAYVDDMFYLMNLYSGLGLAANQVGLPFRFFVTCSMDYPVFINPQILSRRDIDVDFEGCLSLPKVGAHVPVRRSRSVVVEAYDIDGNLFLANLDSQLARVVQHELDHLDGVLFFDHFKRGQREGLAGDLRELELRFERAQERGEVAGSVELVQRLVGLMEGSQ